MMGVKFSFYPDDMYCCTLWPKTKPPEMRSVSNETEEIGRKLPCFNRIVKILLIYKKASFFIAKTSFFNHLAMRTKTCKNSSWDQRSTLPPPRHPQAPPPRFIIAPGAMRRWRRRSSRRRGRQMWVGLFPERDAYFPLLPPVRGEG